LSRGKSNDQIAILMKIEVCTVRKHLVKVYDVLGVENRAAAACFGHYYSFILGNGADDSR
jgi:DNA-binding NarL/FixJ family response regulator